MDIKLTSVQFGNYLEDHFRKNFNNDIINNLYDALEEYFAHCGYTPTLYTVLANLVAYDNYQDFQHYNEDWKGVSYEMAYNGQISNVDKVLEDNQIHRIFTTDELKPIIVWHNR